MIQSRKDVTATTILLGIIGTICVLAAVMPAHADWQQIRKDAAQVLLTYNQIEHMNHLYVVDSKDRGVYRKISATSWEKISEPGSQFVQGRAVIGTTLYKLSPNKDAVYQYNGPNGWKKVGGPAKRLYGGRGGLYAISPENDEIYSFDPVSNRWTKVGGPSKAFTVGGKNELYGISVDGKALYRYLGTPGKWERIGNATRSIFAAPGYLYRIDGRGRIQQYNGKPMDWTPIGGQGSFFAVTEEADVYGLSSVDKRTFRYLGTPGQWLPIDKNAVSIVAQRDELYSIQNDGTLWKYVRPTRPNEAELLIIAKDAQLGEAIDEYARHKRLHGFNVAVVTLDEVLRTKPGCDNAESIRNFLIEAHRGQLLHYVLMLGDVDTIPTKMFFRDNGQFAGNRPKHNAYSTDFYYANLHTVDWDLDNDGLWGEFADDKLDIRHDIVVSRIPFNDADTVRQVARNMIAFDESRDAPWQRRVVLAHGFMSENNDLAGDAEKIDRDLLVPNGFSSHKLYVNQDKTKSSHFDSAGAEALSDATYIDSLSPQGQGLALLAAHGATDRMSSVYVDNNGDQQWLDFSLWQSVQGHPLDGIFLLNGCNTAPTLTDRGYPSMEEIEAELHAQGSRWSSIGKPVHGNIAKEYLRSGAVAVIASTVGSDAGSQKMEYELTKRLVVDGQTIGDAFIKAKEAAGPKRDYQTFYLVGDPTIRIK